MAGLLAAALPRIVVFAKYPSPGRVKTRLARAIGEDEALRFYRGVLDDVVARLCSREREWHVLLAVTPDNSLDWPGWPEGPRRVPQGPGTLGEKMARLLASATAQSPVIICGSDIPGLTANDVAAAIEALHSADLVIGPSPDGGYWLIGASAPPPDTLFAGVRWSTAHARGDTLARAQGLRLGFLRELEDVDDVTAYERWKVQLLRYTTRRPARRIGRRTDGSD